MRKNWYNNEAVVTSCLIPQVVTTDSPATGVDTLGYDSVVLLVHVGDSGDTLSGSVLIDLELQDSADNSTYAACVDADLENPDTGAAGAVTGTTTGTFARIDAPTEDSAIFAVRYIGDARYVRVNINVTGTHSNGTSIGVIAVRSLAKYK